MHISQPGNRSDELAVYLVSRFCQKYIGVITKDRVWFTGKRTTPKPKHRHHRRKPIVVKEKTYRICRESRHTQKRCSLCKEKFPSQKELNVHVSSVHSFQFLCKSRKCGKKFSSQAALDKHELIHKGPHFFCTKCGDGFLFNYQLKNNANTHVDFVIKCPYPRCGKLYKSEGEYRRHKKVHQTAYQEYACTTCGKKFTKINTGMNIWLFTQRNWRMNVQNVVRNTGGIQTWQNTWLQGIHQPLALLQIDLPVQNIKVLID